MKLLTAFHYSSHKIGATTFAVRFENCSKHKK